jgi:hypothetical protein
MTSMILPPSGTPDEQPRGSQTPRICHVPSSVTSAGQEAVELAELAGLHLDPWEARTLVGALGEDEDGRWSSFEVGLVAPRQNGKGSVLEARELAGLFLFGEKLIIHSAHEQATSSEHFRRLLNLIESVPEFERRVLKAPRGKGAEAIELRGGQRIFFKTRTAGGGRGLTGDLVVLDEAMILQDATVAALVPTMAARSIHGNPQLWYAGSAVDQTKHEHGVVLARVRERGMKGQIAYFEWSAPGEDPDMVPDELRREPAIWAMANPGMGYRISAEHIAKECNGALGPREFAVERLGIGDWPDTSGHGDRVISADVWDALTDLDSVPLDPVCFAFDVSPDRSMASICAAGRRDDGKIHIEVIEHRRGTGWVVDRAEELLASHENAGLICDGTGPAGSLLPEFQAEPRTVTATEHARACGMFFDATEEDSLRHLGTPELSNALAGARKRLLGDAWAWSRKSSAVDISPLVAGTLAFWGVATTDVYAGPLIEVFG